MSHAIPPTVRFWTKVDKTGPIPACRPDLGHCWLWQGWKTPAGYGGFRHTTRSTEPNILAHRFAYIETHGEIPEGLQIDHLCRVRHCVNPNHLETVTPQVNVLRGETIAARCSRATHCPAGHPYSATNTYANPKTGNRTCRTCHRLKVMADRRAKGALPARRRLLTWNGETLSMTEWARRQSLNLNTLEKRLRSGWNLEQALTAPVRTEFRTRRCR